MAISDLVIPKQLKIEPYTLALRNKACRPISQEDAAMLPQLILALADLAKSLDGVGIAAPQVGLFVQLAVLLHDEGKIHALINPVIVSFGGRDLTEAEGCLSLEPSQKAQARVTRSEVVTINAGDLEDVRPHIRSTHRGYAARVVQHEIDHLQGTFFVDRVSALQRDLALRRHAKWVRTGR